MPIELGSFDVIIDIGDETLTIRSNRSGGYASIVASEQRAELFGRIDTLEWDNMRLRGMLGVERQRVDRLRRKQPHDEVYGCLKYVSGNSGGRRLAISMVEEAWLSEKEE
ncbi:hypothetical protein Tco_1421491, partial [Tanacetum coccineum]